MIINYFFNVNQILKTVTKAIHLVISRHPHYFQK